MNEYSQITELKESRDAWIKETARLRECIASLGGVTGVKSWATAEDIVKTASTRLNNQSATIEAQDKRIDELSENYARVHRQHKELTDKYDRAMREIARHSVERKHGGKLNDYLAQSVNGKSAVIVDHLAKTNADECSTGTRTMPRLYRVMYRAELKLWEGTPRKPNNGLPTLCAPTCDELMRGISEALNC